jgi:phage terminase small subunit
LPRKSAAELSMSLVEHLPTRLRPPSTLSPGARKQFLRIVADVPATHFKPSDLPLLIQYCESANLAERAAKELQRDDAEAVWLVRWEKANRNMVALSARLRICPQSRQPNNPKRESLSYYERRALEAGADADSD